MRAAAGGCRPALFWVLSTPLCSARSSCARRWVLLPSVAVLRCAWRWVLRSPHSFPPPTLASFKFAPALSESELINMQNHSVTH